ncbi:hypothetical protein BDM02DRAFT_158937 [Thelephora ganbajun]|uniref:Uncharacterized protein n=1 Tax=Thelephora ganbajun TaxID=370292 RepID=A0ACB6ZX60_THEGA|nr:hypothetical protein BDM02DRAFT_158937 [Thelephora ganbajun]
MRPSVKRALSAGRASDIEPGSALPDEWEKQHLITESNREGEVRGGGEGKEVQQARRVGEGKKAPALLQPSHKKNGVASSSLTLTRRLKAKAVRESPHVRKLRDKLAGRAIAGGTGRRPGIEAALEVSRRGHAVLDACGFPENAGAPTTTSVAMFEEKGTDRASLGETIGCTMPYSGDNQEGGVINRHTGSVVGGPSFRSTLKRNTVPVEFRFELAARLGTSRGSAVKENPGPSASRSSREDGAKAAGSSRKRPRLGELRDGKSGEVGFEEPPPPSRLGETEGDHHDHIGSHAGAWKRNTHSRSKNSSATSMGRSQKRPLIIPEGFRFSTEQRAKDREKFDEAVRVKQKEKERQLEEDHTAKAVEEERGVQEMRKRAVPKANSVPEWYATMPKRKAA